MDFEIRRYDFSSEVVNEFHNLHYAKDLWPIVYILSDDKTREAYVGETTDTYSRISTHLKNKSKKKLTAVHLISSEKFNKSATLDIESNLIRYMAADGQFKLMNGNAGLANHNYFQKKELYWEIFKSIWNSLRAEGISRHSIDYIDNSDLFKYSPYKSLSREQRSGLFTILQNLLEGKFKNFVVEGGAGTGKTILAVFLFKLLTSDLGDFSFKDFGEEENEFVRIVTELKRKNPMPKMALVVPMSSFRNTLKKVFRNIKGLNAKMVIGPADVAKQKYDLLVVDEAHRLRRRVNLGTYFGSFDAACEKLGLDKTSCSEVDWILKQSKNAIFFYDQDQSIKPSDARKEDFDKLKSAKTTKVEYLRSQFRVKGGVDYVKYIDRLLNTQLGASDGLFDSKDYEFLLFDSIEDIVQEIKARDRESGLSRLVAGYAWEWISKKNGEAFDIEIDDIKLQWNTSSNDWVNSDNAVNEVGCIHTTQGYDLNYAGIIFGNEISYDKEKGEIVILKENYHDKNGKQSITDPEELRDFILNIYKTILLRGIKGTYIYVCDPDLREYFARHIPRFKKKRTIRFVPAEKVQPFENAIPLYELTAAAGGFSENQVVADFEWLELPSRYKPSEDLFACRVEGESMNKVIPNGSICLFRKYTGGSRDGRIVLVQHANIQDPDFGAGYTVKEYRSQKMVDSDGWRHTSILLKPLSFNSSYSEIMLEEDDLADLKVIGIFEGVLYGDEEE